mmetsp:Transcript_8784/g.27959  ORF Transcript_8784/g.27959 Transcript_8784/m.27959 type:complete len:209 (-) Transcript_8784:8-634(-)
MASHRWCPSGMLREPGARCSEVRVHLGRDVCIPPSLPQRIRRRGLRVCDEDEGVHGYQHAELHHLCILQLPGAAVPCRVQDPCLCQSSHVLPWLRPGNPADHCVAGHHRAYGEPHLEARRVCHEEYDCGALQPSDRIPWFCRSARFSPLERDSRFRRGCSLLPPLPEAGPFGVHLVGAGACAQKSHLLRFPWLGGAGECQLEHASLYR